MGVSTESLALEVEKITMGYKSRDVVRGENGKVFKVAADFSTTGRLGNV